MTHLRPVSGLAVCILASAAAASIVLPAHAAGNAVRTACFEKWQSEKDSGTVPSGTLWANYYKKCAAGMRKASKVKKAAPAVDDTTGYVPPEPSKADVAKAVATKDAAGKPLSASEIALRRRIKKCGAEWHLENEKGTLAENETWAQFWNACNMRLKKEG